MDRRDVEVLKDKLDFWIDILRPAKESEILVSAIRNVR